MKQVIIVSIFGVLMACAGPTGMTGETGAIGPAGPTGPGTVDSQPDVDSEVIVVREYNEDRVAKGQNPITRGLACSLYTVPNTTTQIVGATLTTVGSWTYTGTGHHIFNDPNGNSAPGLKVLPAPLRSVFTSYYLIKCTGLFVVPISGYYEWELSSDDGAIMTVGSLTVNNDGTHGITSKSGVGFLSRGAVNFSMQYFDIGGSHALMLKSLGVPISASNFFH